MGYDMYLKLVSKQFSPIPGNGPAPTYSTWMKLNSFGYDAQRGDESVHGFTVTKSISDSDPLLFLACAVGTTFETGYLDLVNTDGQAVLHTTFTDVHITGMLPTGGSSVDDGGLIIQMAFSTLIVGYVHRKPAGRQMEHLGRQTGHYIAHAIPIL